MCKQWDTIQLNIYISFRISNQCTASIIFHIQQHNFFLLFLLAAKLSILFLLHSVDRIVYNLLLKFNYKCNSQASRQYKVVADFNCASVFIYNSILIWSRRLRG